MTKTFVLALLLLIPQTLRAAPFDDADLDQRIDRLRRGDFVVHLVDENGQPLNGEVKYELKRHAFKFGTAVNADFVLHRATPSDLQKYTDIVSRYFNYAVEENSMKWHTMEPRQGTLDLESAPAIWNWCHALGIPMRGHCIFWGVEERVPAWTKSLSPEQLRDAMTSRLRTVLTLMNGKIREWDLNNEMVHGDYFAKKMGLKNGAEYFKWAHAIAPNVRFYANDFCLQQNRTADYVKHIREMLADGAPIGGIGDQCHFYDGMPTNEKLFQDLDQLAQFKLPIQITEFDDGTADESLQAQNLTRFYKVCFAHPAVDAILMWGFWEGRHWRKPCALWRLDWSIKPNGEAYVDLMERTFATRGETVANDGRISFRGFYGDYAIKLGDRYAAVALTADQPKVTVRLSK